MQKNKNLAQNYEWFKKAEEDELSIRAIFKEKGAPSTVCFLSQQMAEKYLKALLLFYKNVLIKTHDLLELETLLAENEPKVALLHKNLVILNRFYIETRYPGAYEEFSWNDAKTAFASAEKVKGFVVDLHDIYVAKRRSKEPAVPYGKFKGMFGDGLRYQKKSRKGWK